MPIRCVCPKGHVLKVQESFAGSTGLCPVCKSRVRVPALRNEKVSEDAVMAILGPPEEPVSPSDVLSDADQEQLTLEANLRSGVLGRSAVVKACSRCKKEIPVGTHICPYCRTYIAQLSDF
jgi:hypothetical protein